MITYTKTTQTPSNFANFKTILKAELDRYALLHDEYTDATYTYLVYKKVFSANTYGTAYVKFRLRDQSTYCSIDYALSEAFNNSTHTATNENTLSVMGNIYYGESHSVVSVSSDEIWGVTFQSNFNNTRKAPLLIFRNINNSAFLGSENNYSWLSQVDAQACNYAYGLKLRTVHSFPANNSNNCYYFNENDFGINYLNPITGKISLLNLFFLQGTFQSTAATRACIDNIFTDILIGSQYPIGTIITDSVSNYICLLHTGYNNAGWGKIS